LDIFRSKPFNLGAVAPPLSAISPSKALWSFICNTQNLFGLRNEKRLEDVDVPGRAVAAGIPKRQRWQGAH